ncbi:MAG: hypothetical protein V4633_14275 [Pseudomonadota bacterium]
MPAEPSGLATVEQIEALADQLSACADQLHERVMADVRAHGAADIDEQRKAAVRALLDDEIVLRQRANSLYADAATLVVKSLGQSQLKIVRLTADAAEKIRKIAVIGDVTGIVGGLLLLAGAAASGQPAAIVLAIEKLRRQTKLLEAHSPKKA